MKTTKVIYGTEVIIDKTLEDLTNEYDGGLIETDLANHIIGPRYDKTFADDDLKDYFEEYGVFISTLYDDLRIIDEPEEADYFLSIPPMYLFNYMLLKHNKYIEKEFGIRPINKSHDEVTDDDIDISNMAHVVICKDKVYKTNDFEYLWMNLTRVTIRGKDSYYDYTDFGWESDNEIKIDKLFKEVSDLTDIDKFICGDPYADDGSILEYENPVEVDINVDELPVIYTNEHVDWIKVKYQDGTIEYYDLIFD